MPAAWIERANASAPRDETVIVGLLSGRRGGAAILSFERNARGTSQLAVGFHLGLDEFARRPGGAHIRHAAQAARAVGPSLARRYTVQRPGPLADRRRVHAGRAVQGAPAGDHL